MIEKVLASGGLEPRIARHQARAYPTELSGLFLSKNLIAIHCSDFHDNPLIVLI